MSIKSMGAKINSEVQTPIIDIHPSHGWIPVNLKDLWLYRELLYFLTWREIKVPYKQTVLGFAWAVIQPFPLSPPGVARIAGPPAYQRVEIRPQ